MLVTEATVRKIGNSQGVIFDKAVCDNLGISCGSKLSILCDGGCLTIFTESNHEKPRIGIAKGRKLVSDDWFSEEMDREVAAMFGVFE